MGFELYLDVYKDGEHCGISYQRALDAFEGFATILEPALWQVKYDETSSCDIYVSLAEDDASEVSSFMVERPCADRRLWESLFAIMRLGNVVLYYPGCSAPLVASEDVIPHLPHDMIDSLGQPLCIRSGEEIAIRIKSD